MPATIRNFFFDLSKAPPNSAFYVDGEIINPVLFIQGSKTTWTVHACRYVGNISQFPETYRNFLKRGHGFSVAEAENPFSAPLFDCLVVAVTKRAAAKPASSGMDLRRVSNRHEWSARKIRRDFIP